MTRCPGRTPDNPGHVRPFPPGLLGQSHPDGHGHTPIGVSVCPAIRRPEFCPCLGDPSRMEHEMIEAIRERLFAMRGEEIARILKRSASAQLAGLEAAIMALDELPSETQSASRAVVSDDGQEI